MLTTLKINFVKACLGGLAKSNDTKTTVLGLAAAALIGAQLDWAKLLHGDPQALGEAVGAVVAALIGYYTNKPDNKPDKKLAK